jgi:hypothetical protein
VQHLHERLHDHESQTPERFRLGRLVLAGLEVQSGGSQPHSQEGLSLASALSNPGELE